MCTRVSVDRNATGQSFELLYHTASLSDTGGTLVSFESGSPCSSTSPQRHNVIRIEH